MEKHLILFETFSGFFPDESILVSTYRVGAIIPVLMALEGVA
jgi:hypothetical protein